MILANKKIGETPLELIKHTCPNISPVTYAGRLDPMAEGLMILLEGKEEIKQKSKYLNLDKTYDLSVLLGISTDTYDQLGIIDQANLNFTYPEAEGIKKVIQSIPKKYHQFYPPYSSKSVKGHPLWWWAKNNRLDKIKIPTKKVRLHSIKLNKVSYITSKDLMNQVLKNITKVKGDFRQENIAKQWKKLLVSHPKAKLMIIDLTINCSSGTYMRSIAKKIGKKLKVPSLALRIKRTRLGKHIL